MNAIGQPARIAGTNDWAKFLAPLVASVRNKPDSSEFTPFCAACADALAIPADWLTPARRREAMTKFAFWPAVADVADLFAEDKRHAMSMAGYRNPSGVLAPPEASPPLTEAQKADALAKAAAFRADMAALAQADRPKANALPLAPHHLLAVYEHAAAQGNSAAAYRVAQLRKEVSP